MKENKRRDKDTHTHRRSIVSDPLSLALPNFVSHHSRGKAKQLCYLIGDVFKRANEKALKGDGGRDWRKRRRRRLWEMGVRAGEDRW